MIRVLANGVFDLLHPGHVAHLREARAMGDHLTVALTLDEHVNKGPGRPIYSWQQRAALLRELRCVDRVIATACASDAIRAERAHIFVKGCDYAAGRWTEDIERACEDAGTRIRFTNTPKMSTTETIRKLVAIRPS